MRGLLLLAVCALAEINYAPLFSFSTTLNSSSPDTYYINSFDSISNSCSVSSSLYKYVTFNYTFATAGVRLVNALNTYAVHVAKSWDLNYNISNLCQNGNVWPLEESDAVSDVSGTLNQYGHYYEANVSYTFFVFASTTSNPVIAEVWDSAYNGILSITNSSTNTTWLPLYTSSQNCQQYSSSYTAYFTTKAVTVNASGYYNVFVSFDQNFALPYNYQTPTYPRLAILRGSYSEIDVSNATCANLGSNFTAGDAGDDSAIAILAVWLDGNQTYTFVISADDDNANVWQGHYGITIAPSAYGQFVATALPPFQRPTRGSCDDTCTSDSTSTRDVPYGVAFFTVPENSRFYLWVSEPGSPDLQYYLYKGRNEIGTTGPSTCGLPLQTCIDDGDSITGRYYQSGSNTEYTVVATSYYPTSKFPNGNFTAFVISGPAFGSSGSTRAPTPSTTAPSSQPNNQTNSTSAPSAPTSRQPTTKGQTYAPTSRNPTAPTAPTTPTVAMANTGAMSQPCLFSLIACLAVFKLF